MKFNDLTQQQKDIIAKHFWLCTDFDFLDVFADMLGRLSKEEIDSIIVHGPCPIRKVVRNSMSLPSTQWIVARHYYISPFDVDCDSVYVWICNDLYEVCVKIRKAEE